MKCIINQNHTHTNIQCRVLVSSKIIKAKCWACGDHSISKQDAPKLHIALKNYSKLNKAKTELDEVSWNDLVSIINQDCNENNYKM